MNSRFHSPPGNPFARPSAGFSLIELLTVIAIISILLTVGAVGIGGLTNGKNVTSAVTSTEAMFSEARTIAVGRGVKSRVLINNNPNDKESYLKRVLVIYQKQDANGLATAEWAVSSRGFLLPEGVFFSKTYSKKTSGNLQTMDLVAGTEVKAGYAGNYYYYEINSEGIAESPGSSFVIGSGALTGSDPIVTGKGKRDFGGFVIWRNGTTSLYRGPDQIGIPTTVTTF